MVTYLATTTNSSLAPGYHKIMFLGKQGVGKTSIIQRLVTSKTDSQHQPTLGINFHNVEIEYQKLVFFSSVLMGLMAKQNNNGESESPWNIPLFVCHSEPAENRP